MKQKVTIHRALAELKLIDAKIEKAIADINPSAIHQKDKLIGGYMKQDDFKSAAVSNYDSALSLIKRKQQIKALIVESNSKTKVKVGDAEMTIAEAITEKDNVKFKKQLIVTLQSKHNRVTATLLDNNEKVNKNCQVILEHTFGKDNTKVGTGDMDAVRKPFMEQNEFHLFNPLDVDKKIDELSKEVSTFEMEIDACLSESNATTFIEI